MSAIILIYLIVPIFIFGLLAAATSIGVAKLEAAFPPTGQFVEVQRRAVARGRARPARWAPGAEPAVVLIHGASGNLEDMRLALGEKLASSHRVILIDRPGHGWSARPDCRR